MKGTEHLLRSGAATSINLGISHQSHRSYLPPPINRDSLRTSAANRAAAAGEPLPIRTQSLAVNCAHPSALTV